MSGVSGFSAVDYPWRGWVPAGDVDGSGVRLPDHPGGRVDPAAAPDVAAAFKAVGRLRKVPKQVRLTVAGVCGHTGTQDYPVPVRFVVPGRPEDWDWQWSETRLPESGPMPDRVTFGRLPAQVKDALAGRVAGLWDGWSRLEPDDYSEVDTVPGAGSGDKVGLAVYALWRVWATQAAQGLLCPGCATGSRVDAVEGFEQALLAGHGLAAGLPEPDSTRGERTVVAAREVRLSLLMQASHTATAAVDSWVGRRADEDPWWESVPPWAAVLAGWLGADLDGDGRLDDPDARQRLLWLTHRTLLADLVDSDPGSAAAWLSGRVRVNDLFDGGSEGFRATVLPLLLAVTAAGFDCEEDAADAVMLLRSPGGGTGALLAASAGAGQVGEQAREQVAAASFLRRLTGAPRAA